MTSSRTESHFFNITALSQYRNFPVAQGLFTLILNHRKQQKFFLLFPKPYQTMFEQYCIPELLLSSPSFEPLQDETHFLPQIRELLQVQKQTQLLQKIFSKITHPMKTSIIEETPEDQFERQLQTSIMKRNDSTGSIYSLSCDLINFTFNHQDRLKFGSNGSKCLKQVKDKCSLQTYQYLSKMVQENRKLSRNQKLREKDQQKIDYLQEQKLILEQQIQKERECILNLRNKVQKLTKQNSEIARKMQKIGEQQQRLLKKEQCILYQRKICSSLQRQVRQQLLRLEELCQSLQTKKDKYINTSSQGSCDECEYEKQENTSKSTIDFQVQKPQILQLWKLFNKLQAISELAK